MKQKQLARKIAEIISQFTVDADYKAILPHNHWHVAQRIVRDLEAQGYVIKQGKPLIEVLS